MQLSFSILLLFVFVAGTTTTTSTADDYAWNEGRQLCSHINVEEDEVKQQRELSIIVNLEGHVSHSLRSLAIYLFNSPL